MAKLKAPFPWFGGKSRAADLIWARFGDVLNYVEPFAGSLAVLLASPVHRVETINDLDGFVANFWRATSRDPDAVARYADWPVNEADLIARHIWLVERREDFTLHLQGDPAYFDAKIAGWWVWGQSAWIGQGWCSGKGPWGQVDGRLARAGGVSRQLPHLGNAGRGVHRQAPAVAQPGCGVHSKIGVGSILKIGERLRRVRVACGDWSRVVGSTLTIACGMPTPTAVLLDPPYSVDHNAAYSVDSSTVAHDVRAWCVDHGDDPLLRIALCGYEGEHDELEGMGWSVVSWKANGGYGKADQAVKNATRERIWFSPHCLADEPPQGAFAFDDG